MALELYHSTDLRLKNIVCSLNDEELQILEPCLVELKQRTGITLDPYGTTKLYQNQVSKIIQCLRNIQTNGEAKYKSRDYLLNIIKKLSEFDNGFKAVGD